MLHKNITVGDTHFAHNWEYANAAARLAAIGFVSGDLKKLALQLDNLSLWLLTATTPIWVEIGAANKSNTVAGWAADNPVLAIGVIGYETDTTKFKIGDGATAWNTLPHWRYVPEHITVNTTGGTTVLTEEQNKATSIATAGLLTSNAIIVINNTMAPFVAENGNTGAFTTTFKTTAGTGVAIAQVTHQLLYADGVNVEAASSTGAGSGDMVLASVQTVSGAKTFSDGALKLAGATSGASTLKAPAIAAAHVHTLPAATGTVALTTDITGTNSGTNTGDNATNTQYSGLVTNATHTGDATGSGALTVVALNGANLAALATGILKNTTATGVPSIAVAGDFPTLNQNTSGSSASCTGNAATVTTNANLTGHITSTGNAAILGSFTVAQLNTAISDADVATGGGTATGTNTGDNTVATALTGAPTIAVTAIDLGHASDTTLARVSAGVISVEGVTIPSISSTNTLTNKRTTARTSTEASSATPTINTDNVDKHSITALAVAITSMTTNLTGTPVDGDSLIIEITGTAARAITWGASFEASTVALPTTTVTTTMLTVGFLWNAATSKWRCVASV